MSGATRPAAAALIDCRDIRLSPTKGSLDLCSCFQKRCEHGPDLPPAPQPQRSGPISPSARFDCVAGQSGAIRRAKKWRAVGYRPGGRCPNVNLAEVWVRVRRLSMSREPHVPEIVTHQTCRGRPLAATAFPDGPISPSPQSALRHQPRTASSLSNSGRWLRLDTGRSKATSGRLIHSEPSR